ncbi:MAG: hypothetical protein H6Q84_288 [Deltaproteobacteria bacterium]|nr:hypothetical protein [Deltaproteobacteria bacterium]
MARDASQEMILVFRGTHQVLSAEKRLKRGKVPIRLVPVPRTLTSDCGLAIRIGRNDRERARDVLSASGLLPVSVHVPREQGGYDEVPL